MNIAVGKYSPPPPPPPRPPLSPTVAIVVRVNLYEKLGGFFVFGVVPTPPP